MDNTAKERMQRYRNRKRNGVTLAIDEGVTVEMVLPLGRLPERPRYLTLSDGQVLDRANPPMADMTLLGWKIEALKRCNQADKMIPLKSGALGKLKEMLEVTIGKPII